MDLILKSMASFGLEFVVPNFYQTVCFECFSLSFLNFNLATMYNINLHLKKKKLGILDF